jgi:sulfate adenylyltransferase
VPSNRPHGGKLINRILEGAEREVTLARADQLPRIELNNRQLCDIEQIAVGAFSPLEGFMGQRDYESVLVNQRLANGLPWTLPVTLAITEDRAKQIGGAEEVSLTGAQGKILATLRVSEMFQFDREREAKLTLLTTSDQHPGVQYLRSVGDHCIAGTIQLLERPNRGVFSTYILDPKETRYLFDHRGWNSIVAFQTRNPVHRAHEYILKCALETVDGLLLHPLVGETRGEDVPAEVRLECYLALTKNYLPGKRAVLSLYPAAMRYAGPREAIFHAIARKNYGCTHFVVGRDHAGVGDFYGPYDAQKQFAEFQPDELGITPVCFDATFYCRKCGQIASEKTCGHGADARLVLSGTKVREMLRNGENLPAEFSRPEVAEILREAYRRADAAAARSEAREAGQTK